MPNAEFTTRIARSSTDAATGYASAAFAAYADLAQQSLSFWAVAFDSMVPRNENTGSWYRKPDSRRPTPAAPMSVNPFPWMNWPGFAMQFGSAPPATVFNPFTFWMRAWPLQGSPASWPMAFAMLSAGVPRDVAYSTAQANTALMDVVQTTAKAVQSTFASYHSASGYASAQIKYSDKKVALGLMWPLGAAFAAPWLDMLA